MINKLKNSPLLLSILGGLLLVLSWPPSFLFIFIFIAWIPLLQIVKLGLDNGKSNLWFWKWSALYVFIWNIGTTWWVWFASEGGAIAMLVANTLFMSTVLTAFYFTRKHLPTTRNISLVAYWISFELLHLNWDIDFPWLNLGNSFAKFTVLIQWYEYTGTLGGTLWILWFNIILFGALYKRTKAAFVKPTLLLLLPLLASILIFTGYKSPDNKPVEVLILQPNIEPYNEKFEREPYDITFEMLDTVNAHLTPNTRFVFMPETAIPEYYEEDEWEDEPKLKLITRLLEKNPELSVITGVETFKQYNQTEGNCDKKPTPTSRKMQYEECAFYDVFNAASFFRKDETPKYYHKSKLVPGVEKMPYPKYLGFLERMSIDMGGTSGSLGRSESPVIFYGEDSISTCALICYESIFGNYVREFAEKNPDFLSIITNDGWWRNTPGYKQHLDYGTMRAIETRKYIARSANTGISAIIDDRGVILQKTDWWKKQTIVGEIIPNDNMTFYVRHGDLIGQACKFITIFMFLGAFVKRRTGA